MAKAPVNIAASVRQRLLNLARQQGQLFDVILVTYGLERLLYRLSVSRYRHRFVLKGGMLIALWTEDDKRVTRDADFLVHRLKEEELRAAFTEIMTLHVDDGLYFNTEGLTVTPIKQDQVYGGIRLKTTARLEQARIPITVDLSWGDALVETNYHIDYPSLLSGPSANVRAYPPASVIAEKFQAMVVLGLANGRMKDYYDLWLLSHTLTLPLHPLAAAIEATFQRRDTPIPKQVPIGLTETFATDPQKVQQWAAFTASIDRESLGLDAVIQSIRSTLMPICQKLTQITPLKNSKHQNSHDGRSDAKDNYD